MDPLLLEELLLQVSTLSAVYQKPPGMFINGAKRRALPNSSALARLKVDLPSALTIDHHKSHSPTLDDQDHFGNSPLVLPSPTSSLERQNMQSLNPYLDNMDPAALRFSSNDGQHGNNSANANGGNNSNSTYLQDLINLDPLTVSQNSASVNPHGMLGFANNFSDISMSPPQPTSTTSGSATVTQVFDHAFGSLGLGAGSDPSMPNTLNNVFTNNFTPHTPLFNSELRTIPVVSSSTTSGLQTPTTPLKSAPGAENSSISQVTDKMWSMNVSSSATDSSIIHIPPKKLLLADQQANGLEIVGTFARRQGQMQMELTFSNRGSAPVGDFAIQFNNNYFGITPAVQLALPVSQLMPNSSVETVLPLVAGSTPQPATPITSLQVAIKCTLGIFYFQTQFSFHILLVEDGRLEQNSFLKLWREIPNQSKQINLSQQLPFANIEDIRNKLNMNNVFTVAQRQINVSVSFLYLVLHF